MTTNMSNLDPMTELDALMSNLNKSLKIQRKKSEKERDLHSSSKVASRMDYNNLLTNQTSTLNFSSISSNITSSKSSINTNNDNYLQTQTFGQQSGENQKNPLKYHFESTTMGTDSTISGTTPITSSVNSSSNLTKNVNFISSDIDIPKEPPVKPPRNNRKKTQAILLNNNNHNPDDPSASGYLSPATPNYPSNSLQKPATNTNQSRGKQKSNSGNVISPRILTQEPQNLNAIDNLDKILEDLQNMDSSQLVLSPSMGCSFADTKTETTIEKEKDFRVSVYTNGSGQNNNFDEEVTAKLENLTELEDHNTTQSTNAFEIISQAKDNEEVENEYQEVTNQTNTNTTTTENLNENHNNEIKLDPTVTEKNLKQLLTQLTNGLEQDGISVESRGICYACEQPILGEIIHALDRKYHPEHFFCSVCQKEIGNESFIERDDKVYCDGCYTSYFLPICPKCQKPVLDFCTEAMGQKWHPECFTCNECGKSLGDEVFMERKITDKESDDPNNNQTKTMAYCEKCYNTLFAPSCARCQKPISGKFLHAMDKYWHPECFSCKTCSKLFAKGKFFEYQNQPFCEECYYVAKGAICFACNGVLKGANYIEVGLRKYHLDHFICAYCYKKLQVDSFKAKGDKLFHHECYRLCFAMG